MQKITPCLWFDTQAEEAARFYVSVFPNARIVNLTRYGDASAEASGKPKGTVMTVAFQLEGQDFLALNGGPEFAFTPAISLMVALRNPGRDRRPVGEAHRGRAGSAVWLAHRQVRPLLADRPKGDRRDALGSGPGASGARVMRAILPMKKLDLATLQHAPMGSGRRPDPYHRCFGTSVPKPFLCASPRSSASEFTLSGRSESKGAALSAVAVSPLRYPGRHDKPALAVNLPLRNSILAEGTDSAHRLSHLRGGRPGEGGAEGARHRVRVPADLPPQSPRLALPRLPGGRKSRPSARRGRSTTFARWCCTRTTS